jgi:DNA-binding GntR family transcriptional regulator
MSTDFNRELMLRTEPTLIERAYTRLRDDIVEGQLAPGEKLRVEHLKARYDVSAGTLREALTRLVSDALVEVVDRRGFRVTPVALQDLEELTSLRLHIEIDALRRSIRSGDAAWRARLTKAYEELAAYELPVSPENRKSWEELNVRFHEALISGTASSWTRKVLRLLWYHGERYRRLSMGLLGDNRDVHEEHRYIFESAISGEEARAALALEAHISATINQLVRARRDGRLGSVIP